MMYQPSAFLVLKFGGTSVASPLRWCQIARLVAENIATGCHPVLVCSAVAGVTDALEAIVSAIDAGATPDRYLEAIWRQHAELARALGLDVEAAIGEEFAALTGLANDVNRHAAASAKWRARLMASGELMSTRLGAAWLATMGIHVGWLDARTILRATDDPTRQGAQAYLSARCDCSPDSRVQDRLVRREVQATITQGFIARNSAGETVLLGRGGSDTSAAYFASILDARRLEIWTDVPGMFTADPRATPDARLLPRLSYDEAAVLGSLGAKVLHPRCLTPVRERGIPLAIRWTERPGVDGTEIGPEMSTTGIKAITSRSDLCLIRMRRNRSWQPVGFMSDVSSCFHRHGLSMDLISSSPAEIRATVDLAANPGADDHLPELLADLRGLCEASLERDLICVSIAGTRISEEMPRIALVMHLIGGPKVRLVSHAADDTHVSYVLQGPTSDGFVAAVHSALFSLGGPEGWLGPSWRELRAAGEPDGRDEVVPAPGLAALAAAEVRA